VWITQAGSGVSGGFAILIHMGCPAFEKRMWIIPAYTRAFVGGCFPHAARADKNQF
jgi:hypothetical protein